MLCNGEEKEQMNVNRVISLNEINWRNAGNSFVSLGIGVHYAFIWYLSVAGQNISTFKSFCEEKGQYAMNEATDVRHVVYGKLSFHQWNEEHKKTKRVALWYKPDLKPTLLQYRFLFVEMIHRMVKYK